MKLLDWVFIILLYLKLTDQTDLNWWAITSPVWAPFIVLGAAAILGIKKDT